MIFLHTFFLPFPSIYVGMPTTAQLSQVFAFQQHLFIEPDRQCWDGTHWIPEKRFATYI
jgi:hypothetical protein